jgi:hypothetical protein
VRVVDDDDPPIDRVHVRATRVGIGVRNERAETVGDPLSRHAHGERGGRDGEGVADRVLRHSGKGRRDILDRDHAP